MFGAVMTFLEGLVVLVKVLFLMVTAPILWLLPKSKKDVAGEVVLITGGGSGMGRLMALEFAKHDATVVLWDIDRSGMQKTSDEIKSMGRGKRVHSYVVDVSKREQVYENADEVRRDVGDVTILVNNAGLVNGDKMLGTSDERIELLFGVNSVAHFWTIKAFLPNMMENNHGHIVTLASSAGIFPVNGLVDYCASKFAAVGLHNSMAMELAIQNLTGVKTTLICPYLVKTGMFEGAGGRFDWLLPPLEPEYAVGRIMTAILTNEARVLMPRILHVFEHVQVMLPFEAGFLLAHFVGITSFMDRFTGRLKRD